MSDMKSIQAQIKAAADTLRKLNNFEEWLETVAIPTECSPTSILEAYRKARYSQVKP